MLLFDDILLLANCRCNHIVEASFLYLFSLPGGPDGVETGRCLIVPTPMSSRSLSYGDCRYGQVTLSGGGHRILDRACKGKETENEGISIRGGSLGGGHSCCKGLSTGSDEEHTQLIPGGNFDQAYYVATIWVPDELAPKCMRCQAIFSVTRRKHYCRGGIV